MSDRDEVVAKDHLGHGDAELRLEGVNGGGFGDGELAGRDAEVVLRVRGCCRGEGVGAGIRLVGRCYVVHCGRRWWWKHCRELLERVDEVGGLEVGMPKLRRAMVGFWGMG